MSDISSTVDSDSGNVDYFQGMSLGVPAFTLLPAMWHSWLEFVTKDPSGSKAFLMEVTVFAKKDTSTNQPWIGVPKIVSYPHWPAGSERSAYTGVIFSAPTFLAL
ncbi:hypothetical protein V8E54_012382 [Elaphomyces granulatus]